MKLKKLAAIVMALALTLTMFAGCGRKNDDALVGKWQMELDLTQWVRAVMEESAELSVFAEYITVPDLGIAATVDFQPDGNMLLTVELGALKELVELLEKIAPEIVDMLLEEAGYGELKPIADLLLKRLEDNDSGKINLQGKYETDDGELTLSFSGVLKLLGSAEFDYTITENTLELSGVSLGSQDMEDFLELFMPIKLTKVN